MTPTEVAQQRAGNPIVPRYVFSGANPEEAKTKRLYHERRLIREKSWWVILLWWCVSGWKTSYPRVMPFSKGESFGPPWVVVVSLFIPKPEVFLVWFSRWNTQKKTKKNNSLFDHHVKYPGLLVPKLTIHHRDDRKGSHEFKYGSMESRKRWWRVKKTSIIFDLSSSRTEGECKKNTAHGSTSELSNHIYQSFEGWGESSDHSREGHHRVNVSTRQWSSVSERLISKRQVGDSRWDDHFKSHKIWTRRVTAIATEIAR